MNNAATLEKMRELRLFGMEKAFSGVLDAGQPGALTGDELIAQLIDAEEEERAFRKTARLTRVAAFRSRVAWASSGASRDQPRLPFTTSTFVPSAAWKKPRSCVSRTAPG